MAASNASSSTTLSDITTLLQLYDQSHLLKYKDDVSDSELNDLISQIKSIDFEHVSNLFAKTKLNSSDEKKADEIVPFPLDNQFNLEKYESKERQIIESELYNIGYNNIYAGKCGIIILAGGAGTRLGSTDPKGMYNIGLPSNKPLFQIHFEKALKVKQLAYEYVSNQSDSNTNNGNNCPKDANSINLPIFIMTSTNTHSKTVEFLASNEYFGYTSEQVYVFQQEVYPCLELETGKIIMSTKSKIEVSPNGNGGIYTTLDKTGMLGQMAKMGLVYIQTFGIDNVLAKIGDPLWFGHCFKEKVEVSNKTCQKTEPTEKIGVMCLRNNKPSVIEYSEITEEMANLRVDSTNSNSDLSYSCGNLAIHTFSVEFLQKVVLPETGFIKELPIHVAIKKISYYDEILNKTIKPDTANGCKLEYFIFDTFMFSKNMTTFNILRNEEFSPVKNANGKDSPLTARQDVSRFWKEKILKITNNNVIFDGDGLFEVSNLLSYNGEGEKLLNLTNGKTLKLPLYLS